MSRECVPAPLSNPATYLCLCWNSDWLRLNIGIGANYDTLLSSVASVRVGRGSCFSLTISVDRPPFLKMSTRETDRISSAEETLSSVLSVHGFP